MRGRTSVGLRSEASVLLPAVRPIRDLLIWVTLLIGPLVLTLARIIYEQGTHGPVTAAAIRAATPWAGAVCLGLAGGSLVGVITSRMYHLDSVIRWFDSALASLAIWSAVLFSLPALSSDQVTSLVIGLVVAVFVAIAAVIVVPYRKWLDQTLEAQDREAGKLHELKKPSPKNPASGQP
jgi:hypothetical protein